MTFSAFNDGLGRLALAGALALSVAVGTVACERRPGTGGAETTTGDIVVGMYGSLTGDGASFGQSSREGTELAVDEINSGRRPAGRPQDQAARRRRSEQARRGLERRHQARDPGQGGRRARRSGQPPLARRGAGLPEVSGADDQPLLDQRARHRGRRLHLPRLLHRSVPGRSARQVRLQRSQGAEGGHSQGHPAGLLGWPHRFDLEALHGTRRPGAGSGQLQHVETPTSRRS